MGRAKNVGTSKGKTNGAGGMDAILARAGERRPSHAGQVSVFSSSTSGWLEKLICLFRIVQSCYTSFFYNFYLQHDLKPDTSLLCIRRG